MTVVPSGTSSAGALGLSGRSPSGPSRTSDRSRPDTAPREAELFASIMFGYPGRPHLQRNPHGSCPLAGVGRLPKGSGTLNETKTRRSPRVCHPTGSTTEFPASQDGWRVHRTGSHEPEPERYFQFQLRRDQADALLRARRASAARHSAGKGHLPPPVEQSLPMPFRQSAPGYAPGLQKPQRPFSKAYKVIRNRFSAAADLTYDIRALAPDPRLALQTATMQSQPAECSDETVAAMLWHQRTHRPENPSGRAARASDHPSRHLKGFRG